MPYKILKDGEIVNTIVADESFVTAYCKKNGYTFKAISDHDPATAPTTEDRVAALEAENKTLKAQVSAQSEQMDFYEECIAEMASVVYA